MIINKTSIPGLLIIQPKIQDDDRGYFLESYKYSDFKSKGLPITFLQQNQSKSTKGVLRGLHYQNKLLHLDQMIHQDYYKKMAYGKETKFHLHLI